MLSGDGFGSSLVRQILAAVHETAGSEETAAGVNRLRTKEVTDYRGARARVVHILDFFGKLDQPGDMDQWQADAQAARLLAGAVRNDHV
jgi:hypothetical protein